MAKQYNITITNGTGTGNIFNDTYNVSANVPGYLNTSINPNTLNVVEGTDVYELVIDAEGTLTIHVTEDGTADGVPVVGAKFIRTDSNGNTYGNEVTTDASGNAKLTNLPYDATNSPTIYYKQTASDGNHIFDTSILNTTLETISKVVLIANPLPSLRTIRLTEAAYEGLPVASGSITLS